MRIALVVVGLLVPGCSSSGDDGDDGDDTGAELCRSTDPVGAETPLVMTYDGRAVSPTGLSADELVAYFAIYPDPDVPNTEVYEVARGSRDEPFDGGVPVTAVNTTTFEGHAVETADGLELYFLREDNPAVTIRAYRATRASRDVPFADPTLVLGDIALDAAVSADGQEMFYVYIPSYTSSYTGIVRAVRDGEFFAPVDLLEEQSQPWFTYRSPVISGDGLSFYYTFDDDGTYTVKVMRRATRTGELGTPEDLVLPNGGDAVLWESPDSCRMYIARDGSTYVVERTPI
jgi:hypothetical protein